MRFGIASRPASGMSANGDAFLAYENNGKTLLAVIDGLGHGEEASAASEQAKKYIVANSTKDFEQIIIGLHENLHETRGAVVGLALSDIAKRQLVFCGVGNIEVRIVSDPPMHPASLDGVVGMSLRKAKKFEYQYNSLKAVILHSDGISSKFELSDYPTILEHPQKVSEQILNEWGKKYDDATIVIAVEDEHSRGQ